MRYHSVPAWTFAVASVFALLTNRPAVAAWIANGSPVCTATGTQTATSIVADGQGDAIVFWQDQRNAASLQDIYAQRVSASGTMVWPVDGVAISTANGSQYAPTAIADGYGGAIVAWEDWGISEFDSSDIYVQRVDGSGNVLWSLGGVALCTAGDYQRDPRIESDGSGGAIVTWRDHRGPPFEIDVYAQRVSGAGVPLWTANGVLICSAPGTQSNPAITSDDAGRAIVAWFDVRDDIGGVYAQRLDPSGTLLWDVAGVGLCTFAGGAPDVVSDGNGGAIATWSDFRLFGNADVYVQRVDSDGNVLWAADGVPISTAVGDQEGVQLSPDGAGGAILTWEDYRVGPPDIYAQRVDASGNPLWTPNGVGVCTATDAQAAPQVVGDGGGGGVFVWYDRRAGVNQYDIYAQQVNAAGNPVCTPGGTAICVAAGRQLLPQLVPGASGAIVSWHDNRTGTYDIFAHEVEFCDTPVPVAFTRVVAFEEEGAVVVEWTTSYDEAFEGFRVYRSIAGGVFLDMGDEISPAPRVTYRDDTVEPGHTYRYQIGAVRTDGSQLLSPEVAVQLAIPSLALHQNYPNPFRPTTTLSYSLPRGARVEVEIYSLTGALVRRLYSGLGGAGRNEIVWDGRDASGVAVSSGTYFCRLRSEGRTLTRKMTIVR